VLDERATLLKEARVKAMAEVAAAKRARGEKNWRKRSGNSNLQWGSWQWRLRAGYCWARRDQAARREKLDDARRGVEVSSAALFAIFAIHGDWSACRGGRQRRGDGNVQNEIFKWINFAIVAGLIGWGFSEAHSSFFFRKNAENH